MTDLVIDTGGRELVITPPPATTIEIGTPGPQGPPGPVGPAGGETFTYDRAGVPAATWTIVHNLGRYPQVMVLGDNGDEVTTDVTHPDADTTVVTFGVPFSGKAVLG